MTHAAASAFFRSPKSCTPQHLQFPALRNGVRRRVRVFPLAEMTHAAASAFFRSPKSRTPSHLHFPARRKNAERTTRVFLLSETTRSALRTFFRSPKRRGEISASFRRLRNRTGAATLPFRARRNSRFLPFLLKNQSFYPKNCLHGHRRTSTHASNFLTINLRPPSIRATSFPSLFS